MTAIRILSACAVETDSPRAIGSATTAMAAFLKMFAIIVSPCSLPPCGWPRVPPYRTPPNERAETEFR